MSYQYIVYKQKESFVTITLNRPEALNAINYQMGDEFYNAIETIEKDDLVRSVIIKGAGEKAFCAGRDIKELAGLTPLGSFFGRKMDTLRRALELLTKPSIAALHGYVLGGGLELAVSCDFRISTDDAIFSMPEVGRGIIPGAGGTQRLARLIGLGKALELVLTAEKYKAGQALNMGLVNQVVQKSELIEAAENLARSLGKHPPQAVRLAKEAVYRGWGLPLGEALRVEDYLVALAKVKE